MAKDEKKEDVDLDAINQSLRNVLKDRQFELDYIKNKLKKNAFAERQNMGAYDDLIPNREDFQYRSSSSTNRLMTVDQSKIQ